MLGNTGHNEPSGGYFVKIDTNAATGDSFSRLRVSEPYTLFESKLLDGGGSRVWSEQLGGGGLAQKSDEDSEYVFSVYSNNDYVIHQTLQRWNYQAGKSHLAFFTGSLPVESDISAAIGLAEGDHNSHVDPYGIYNGIYFESIDGTAYVTIANNGVYDRVPQSEWNLDKMNGAKNDGEANGNPSGITIDWDADQIFVISFQWLGIGRVSMGVDIGGVLYYVHQFAEHANFQTGVYTRTPNLPVRYELRSTGGATTMAKICSTVMSEGGREPTGFNHIGSSEAYVFPTSGTFVTSGLGHYCTAAMRHQEMKPYSFVRLVSQSIMTLGSNPVKWSIALVPGTLEIDLNGTPTALDDLTFNSLPDSTLEFYSFDATGDDSVTDAQVAAYIIEEGYIPDTGGGANPLSFALGTTNNIISLGEEINGSRWVFLFLMTCYGAETFRQSLKFTEVI